MELRELRLGSSLEDDCEADVSDDDDEDDNPVAYEVALNGTFNKLCSLSLHGSLWVDIWLLQERQGNRCYVGAK